MPLFCPAAAEWGSVAEWVGGVGSFAAVAVALGISGKADRDARKREAAEERAIAHKTTMKIIAMYGNFKAIDRHLNIPFPPGWPDGQRERWKVVEAIVGMSREGDLRIEPNETNLFLKAGESQFAMDLALLGRRHATAFEMLDHYAREREAHVLRQPIPDVMEGTWGTGGLTAEQMRAQAPFGARLERMIASMTHFAAEDFASVTGLAQRFGPICQRYFGDPKFPLIQLAEGDAPRG